MWLLCALLSACSPRYGYVQREIAPSDVSGVWQLTADTLRRLERDHDISKLPRDTYLNLLPSGECGFSSYSAAAREFVHEKGTWRIDHNVATTGKQKVPNLLSISFATRKTEEQLYVGQVNSEVVLWCYADNGWGDEFTIAYNRKRKGASANLGAENRTAAVNVDTPFNVTPRLP